VRDADEVLPYPTDPARAILYLVQMEGGTPVPRLGGSDVWCVTWKVDTPPCSFAPKSSWTQGRNYLWKKAVESPRKYTYYVFMDEDITLSNITLFEEHLLRYLPPIGVPAGIAQLYGAPDKAVRQAGHEAIILLSFDAAFNAFHHDVMHSSLLLPYCDLFDGFSWWISQLYMIYLSQILYAREVVGLMRITTSNALHRNYPRGWNMTATDQFFHKYIILDPELKQTLRGYFWDWQGVAHPKPPNQRYHLPDVFVTLADSLTPYWLRIAEIRNSKDGIPPLPEDLPSVTGPNMAKVMFGFK